MGKGFCALGGSFLIAVLFPFSLFAAEQPVGVVNIAAAPVPLIALPYDEPFRIAPPRIISTLGLQEATTATITVNFVAAGGTSKWGDSCLAWPAAAQTAFAYAASLWATQISSSVPMVIQACWASNLTSPILGHAGATGNYYGGGIGMPTTNTFYPIALINAVRGDDVLNGAEEEIAAAFNANFLSWYFGTDGNTPAGKIDFVSVVLHEIGHGLGVTGTMHIDDGLGVGPAIECDGITGHGCWGWGFSIPLIYDRFTENGAGQSLINTAVFPNPSAGLAAQLTGGSVYFDGPNAKAANADNGQGPVKLYAPSAWSAGSSYAHLDYDTYRSTENALMVYAMASATARHSPGPVTLCLLKDLGWTVPATCDTIALSNSGASVAHTGGAGAVNVINGRCCDWTAVSSSPSWLHVTSSPSGKGNGSVGYLVDANAGGPERSGTITIAGQTFTVTQDADLPPVAGFTFSPLAAGSVPRNVSFTDTSVNATSWAWDFGDGVTSTVRNPFHTYQAAGTGSYTVVLSVNGGADSVFHNVPVSVSACSNSVARLLLKNIAETSLLNAYAQVVSDGEVVEVQAIDQTGPFLFGGDRVVTLAGGYDCEYSANRLYTVLHGLVTINGNGALIMDSLIIQ